MEYIAQNISTIQLITKRWNQITYLTSFKPLSLFHGNTRTIAPRHYHTTQFH